MAVGTRSASLAQTRDRDSVGVDEESTVVEHLAGQRRHSGPRQLHDAATPVADEMPVAMVRAVVHDGIRIELQRRNNTELGEEVQGAIHGRSVRSAIGGLDRIEDLGCGEVMLARVQDRFEHGAPGRSDPPSLRADLGQCVLDLVAHGRTVCQPVLLHLDRNKLRVRLVATRSQLWLGTICGGHVGAHP